MMFNVSKVIAGYSNPPPPPIAPSLLAAYEQPADCTRPIYGFKSLSKLWPVEKEFVKHILVLEMSNNSAQFC